MAARRPPAIFGAMIAVAAALYARRGRAPRQHRPPVRAGWGRIMANVWRELDRDYISVMAAGVGFYGFLSIFPGMAALILLYGLVADPSGIENQLATLSGVLPHQALQLLSDQLQALVAAPPAKLGIGLIASVLVMLWSATSGAGTLMQALTVAFEEEENRGVVGFYAQAAALTIGIALFALASLFRIAIVPVVLGRLPFPAAWQNGLALVRWPILALLAFASLALVYRFAPARRTPRWHWFAAGTIAAAILWLLASAGFSFYVARFASYSKTYGSLGAVAVLLLWLYVSSYVVLFGAELNSEIDKARAAQP
jgi:membrane protein